MSKKRIGTRSVDRVMRVAAGAKGTLAPTLASALWKEVAARDASALPPKREDEAADSEALERAADRRAARAAKRVKR